MKNKSERNSNITENSHKLKDKGRCQKECEQNAKKNSVSSGECDIVVGVGTNYCPPNSFCRVP